MAVPGDAECEAAPRLGMDRAVEEGPAVELLPAGFGTGDPLEEDLQRVMPGGVLSRIADRGGDSVASNDIDVPCGNGARSSA